MTWFFSFGWLCRVLHKRRQRRPARRWVHYFRPRLEPLEERRLFDVNVWLPQRLDPLDGTTQTNQATPLFQPAAATLLPDLSLQSTTVSATGSISLTDSGVYSLTLTQSGPDGSGNSYTFTEGGNVSFLLVELGTLSAGSFSINSVTLTQTANQSWTFLETNSSGQTVEDLSGNNSFTVQSNGAAPFDPFFPAGLNWLSLKQQIDSLDSLGLYSLSADSVTVAENNGSESYVLQKTNGLATISGNVQQPLGDALDQSGQNSYGDTAVEQFGSTESGSDSFSLSELGNYSNGSYALSSVAYQETGTQSSQFNATVVETQSGTGSGSGVQSFSGNNHTLGGSSGESFQLSSLSTTSYGESASGNYSLSQSGSFGGGSFSLGSLSYGETGTGGYSLTQTSLQTQTGTFSSSGNDSGTDSYGVAGTLIDSGTATESGTFTATQSGTLQDNESGAFTLSEAGGYGNASWSLSSFNLSESLSGSFSQQQVGTTTQTGNSTATDSGGGNDSFLLTDGSLNTTTGGGTSNSTNTNIDSFTQVSTSSSTQSGPSSFTLSELGAFQNGSVSLTSYVFSAGQSGTYTAGGGANETDIGNGHDTASGSDNDTQTASLASAGDNVVGDDNFSASDSFSFTSTDSSSSTDTGTFGQSAYRAGVYNSGSWALSSVALGSDRTDNGSATDNASSTDSGSDTSSDGSGDEGNSTVQFGNDSATAGGGDSFSESDFGTFLDSSDDTTTQTSFAQLTLTQLGSYGNFSFSYGSVTYQSTGTATDTTQETDDDNSTDSDSESFSDDSNQTSTDSLANSTDTGLDDANDSSSESFTATSIATITETINASDTTSEFQSGSFLGGLWSLSSVSLGDSSSDSFTEQDLDSSTDSGTDSSSSSDSGTSDDTSVFGGGSASGSDAGNDSVNAGDTFTDRNNDTVTDGGVASFSLSEQGSFANYSFAFSSVVYQGGDSINDTSVESSTDTSIGVETDSSNDGSQFGGVGTYGFGTDSNTSSASDSGSDSFSTGGSDSTSETDSGGQSDSYYESGQFSGGSLSLSVVSLSSGGNDSWTLQSSDTSTDSGTLYQGDNGGGTWQMQLPSGPGPTDNSGASFSASDVLTGNASDTSYDSSTESGTDSWSLTQLGSYGNDSYSFASVVSSDGGTDNDTLSESSTDSFSGTLSDNNSSGDSQSDSGVDGYDNVNDQDGDNAGGSDSFNESDNGQSDETVTSSSSWSDYQAGSFSGNSWSLSSVADSSGGSDTWTEQGNDTSSASGAETVNAGLSVSGGDGVSGYSNESSSGDDTLTSADTLGGSDTGASTDSSSSSGSDSWSQSESGTYGGDSFAFTNVVFQSGGSSSGCLTDSSSDTFQGSLNTIGSDSGQESGIDSLGLDNGSDDGQSSSSGNLSETLQIDSTDTVSGGEGGSWSQYESGSYAGGSFAFTSLSYQDGGSDSTTETVASTTDGTFTGSGSDMESVGGGWFGSSAFGDQAASSDTVNGNSSGTDGGSGSMTELEGDNWSLSEQGSYANGSYSLSNYVSSSGDSTSVNAQQTDSVSETVSAAGVESSTSGESNVISGLVGTWITGTFAAGADDDGLSDNVGTFTETVNATDTTDATTVETFSASQSQSGIYAAGSFSLSNVLYTQSSSSSMTAQSDDTFVSADTQQEDDSSSEDQYGYGIDGYGASSDDSGTSQDTVTGGDTRTEQSQSSGSVYEDGSYSNDSYSLSSYALSQSGGDTVTSSSSDTVSSLSSGSTSGSEEIDGWTAGYDGSGVFTRTGGGTDSAGATQTDGWSLLEQGSFSGGSFALSSFVFAEQQGSSSADTDSGSWSETIAGTNESDNYSGDDTGSEGDNQSESANGNLLEEGSASNGSLTLSVVSYSGSGSESGGAQDSSSGVWSGSYSGNDSAQAWSGDGGSYSVSALGSFVDGSMNFSSYVLQGGSSESSSQSASEGDTLMLGSMESMSNEEHFSRSDLATGQASDSVYQSGTSSGGVYANASYNVTENTAMSGVETTSVPSYFSDDTWSGTDTLSATLSGASATDSSSMSFEDTDVSGSAVCFAQSSPSVPSPGLLVNVAAPDGSVLPVVGADESGGGGLPVSSPSLGVVGSTGAWLLATGSSVQEATQPESAMPMELPGAGEAPTEAPPPATHPPLDGAALTPGGSGPDIQMATYAAPTGQASKPAPQQPTGPKEKKGSTEGDNPLQFNSNTFRAARIRADKTPLKNKVTTEFNKAIKAAEGDEKKVKKLQAAQEAFNKALDTVWQAYVQAKNKAKQTAAKAIENRMQPFEASMDLNKGDGLLRSLGVGGSRYVARMKMASYQNIDRQFDWAWVNAIAPAMEYAYLWQGLGKEPTKEDFAHLALFFGNKGDGWDLQLALQISKGTELNEFLESVQKYIIEAKEKKP